MRSRSMVLWVAAGLLLAGPSRVWAGPNASFTLPLHVVASNYEPCDGYLPVDCLGNRPTTTVVANHLAVVYLLISNHSEVAALQAGLEWDPSWTWSFSLFDCLPGQLEGIFRESATTASGVTTFNCLQGPGLAAVGRLFFMAGHAGCLRFRQPPFPFGIHVYNCSGFVIDQITDASSPRLGRVCVGGGGHDACDAVVPVEGVTWGAIKRSF